jgi:hypothetical protein
MRNIEREWHRDIPEVAGTAGAFASSSAISRFGNNYSFFLTPSKANKAKSIRHPNLSSYKSSSPLPAYVVRFDLQFVHSLSTGCPQRSFGSSSAHYLSIKTKTEKLVSKSLIGPQRLMKTTCFKYCMGLLISRNRSGWGLRLLWAIGDSFVCPFLSSGVIVLLLIRAMERVVPQLVCRRFRVLFYTANFNPLAVPWRCIFIGERFACHCYNA